LLLGDFSFLRGEEEGELGDFSFLRGEEEGEKGTSI